MTGRRFWSSWCRVLPWAFWLPIGFTSYMAWTPVAHPNISHANDKVMHILAFGYLTGAFSIAYAHSTTWLRTAGVMLAYAALIEVVQGLIPNRESSLLDFVADGMAIVLALSGLYVINKVARFFKQQADTP